MKLRIIIALIIILCLGLFYCAAYLFLVFDGKTVLTNHLENFTGKKVTIGTFKVTPPLNIEMGKVDIQDFAKIEHLFISPSPLRFLTGRIGFNEIRLVAPSITLKKTFAKEGDLISVPEAIVPPPASAAPTIASTKDAVAVESTEEKIDLNLVIKRISIKRGEVNFIDETAGTAGIKITINEIFLDVTNLYLPSPSLATNFSLKGNIPWSQDNGKEQGKIDFQGWINLYKKDMDASLKINDIDGLYFYPYYSKWVDLEKARIEQAKLNFNSNIHGFDNNLTAECHLELTDIVFKQREPEEAEQKAEKIANAMLDIFKAMNQGKIVLDFTIRTKMDRPEFGFGDIQMAFEEKFTKARKGEGFDFTGLLKLPAKIVESTVKSAADVSKAVIDGTYAVGNEIKKAVTGKLGKELEKKP